MSLSKIDRSNQNHHYQISLVYIRLTFLQKNGRFLIMRYTPNLVWHTILAKIICFLTHIDIPHLRTSRTFKSNCRISFHSLLEYFSSHLICLKERGCKWNGNFSETKSWPAVSQWMDNRTFDRVFFRRSNFGETFWSRKETNKYMTAMSEKNSLAHLISILLIMWSDFETKTVWPSWPRQRE
jgi:hypothetical protein